MSFKLLGGGSDLGTVVNDVNQNILELKNREVTEIFKDDNGVPVVILDKDGLRTTNPGSGIDVTNATNSEYTFNSAQKAFKIVRSGTCSLDGSSATVITSSSVTVPHNLGYAPVFAAYLELTGGGLTQYLPLPTASSWSASGGSVTMGNLHVASTDNDNFYVNFFTGAVAAWGTQTYKYYLLQESAN